MAVEEALKKASLFYFGADVAAEKGGNKGSDGDYRREPDFIRAGKECRNGEKHTAQAATPASHHLRGLIKPIMMLAIRYPASAM